MLGEEKDSGVLPNGVVVCPEAAKCLEQALWCLGCGLPVMALYHTEEARALLDVATEAPNVVEPNKT